MEYKDFIVTFEAFHGEEYGVTVQSPGGCGNGSLRLPADLMNGDLILRRLARAVSRHPSVRDPKYLRDLEGEPAPPEMSVEEFGTRLYEALFADPMVRGLFLTSRGQTATSPDGLRIQLRMDLSLPEIGRLAELPWEFLYSAADRSFLSLSRTSPLVRYLTDAQPLGREKLPDLLRILVVISSPANLTPLDVERERAEIEASWKNEEDIEFFFLEKATLGNLRRRLSDEEFHVLHFIGHGAFRAGKGLLFFEDQDGNADAVNADVLVAIIKDFKSSISLIFLNACQTAQSSSNASLANALVKDGFPAVVAMQFPISDRAAISFSATVYHHIARGERLETAVAEGRMAIRTAERDSLEWGTPVLFTRLDDGHLFKKGLRDSLLIFWSISGTVTFFVCMFFWVRSTFADKPSLIFGLLLGGPLTFLTLYLVRRYDLEVDESDFWRRSPSAFGLTRDKAKSAYRTFQMAWCVLFVLVPLASQIHFLRTLSFTDVYRKGADVFSRNLEQYDLKHFIPLLDAIKDDFRFAAPSDSVTYFPFWEPWYFLVLTVFLFVYSFRVALPLFRKNKPKRKE